MEPIQGDFNNGMFQTAMLAAVSRNGGSPEDPKKVKLQEIENKIKEIEIEIAKNKDSGVSTTELEKLLKQYNKEKSELVNEIIEEQKEAEEKRKRTTKAILIISGLIGLIYLIIILVMIGSLN